MTFQDLVAEANAALQQRGWPIAEAPKHIPASPGLYALHASQAVWIQLGLAFRPGIPLYIGKSESSLVARELGQHFAIDRSRQARTGGSTVRRSFAALLRDALQIEAVPRNKDKPERFANFGLELSSDERLTEWMHANLTLIMWPMPVGLETKLLDNIESALIREWTPPINIAKNPRRLSRLSNARATLAAEARAWSRAPQ